MLDDAVDGDDVDDGDGGDDAPPVEKLQLIIHLRL